MCGGSGHQLTKLGCRLQELWSARAWCLVLEASARIQQVWASVVAWTVRTLPIRSCAQAKDLKTNAQDRSLHLQQARGNLDTAHRQTAGCVRVAAVNTQIPHWSEASSPVGEGLSRELGQGAGMRDMGRLPAYHMQTELRSSPWSHRLFMILVLVEFEVKCLTGVIQLHVAASRAT